MVNIFACCAGRSELQQCGVLYVLDLSGNQLSPAPKSEVLLMNIVALVLAITENQMLPPDCSLLFCICFYSARTARSTLKYAYHIALYYSYVAFKFHFFFCCILHNSKFLNLCCSYMELIVLFTFSFIY